ncbi:MAG: Hsp70 family protein [Pyrinomonadaceae bacterium]|nr:Hsp70 family protein [Pyrinomonadaceae bacterium]
MNRIVGIDLGTTNSLIAVVENKRPRVLERGGQRLIPSVVGRTDDNRIIVGQEALNQYVLAPERTVRSIKRKMGTTEPVKLGDGSHSPEEISAFILRHLKQMAEEILGEKVDRAVITVPAYFNDAQRQATTRAGQIAGLEVVRIINEPTAAALVYGLDQQANQYLMVYDLGGGTFDVSIIEQHGEIMEVRSSHGNVHLGGDDFDERVLQHLLAHLSGEHRYDFKEDRRAMARLVRAAERAKTKLSDAPYAKVTEEFLARYDGQAIHLNTEIGREEFEGMIEDLLDSTIESVHKALGDATLTAEQINRVLLVGGSTRIPRVWELIKSELGIEPSIEVNPDEAVALGAAVQAAIIDGDDVQTMLIDVSPHSLGVEVASIIMGDLVPGFYKPIIRRNTTIPTTKSERFYTISPQQDTVEVSVFQGESQVCVDNTLLGQFKLSGLPPSENPELPREVIIEFSYNLNGVVEVSARDRRGERCEMMTVNAATGKRAASEVETKHHFDPALEQDVARSLKEATTLELELEADGNREDAERLRGARHALEEAHEQGGEKQVREAVEAIEDLIYDLE